METLVAVGYPRNQYYNGSRNGGNSRDGFGLGLSPVKGFREVNCRGFDAGIGLLPSPFMGSGSPVLNRGFLSPNPKKPFAEKSPFGGGGSVGKWKSEDVKGMKKFGKSSPIAISFDGGSGGKERQMRESVCFSERWAGPAYSNSPPPSSVPMPNFGMKPKRTVSLELPAIESDFVVPPMAKSAPASPTKDGVGSVNGFFSDDDSATKTLRRILNLDIADD